MLPNRNGAGGSMTSVPGGHSGGLLQRRTAPVLLTTSRTATSGGGANTGSAGPGRPSAQYIDNELLQQNGWTHHKVANGQISLHIVSQV